jgi:hypothetical protein
MTLSAIVGREEFWMCKVLPVDYTCGKRTNAGKYISKRPGRGWNVRNRIRISDEAASTEGGHILITRGNSTNICDASVGGRRAGRLK